MHAREKTTQTSEKYTNFIQRVFWLVFFPWIFSKVFARAEVKHTIYFNWPRVFSGSYTKALLHARQHEHPL